MPSCCYNPLRGAPREPRYSLPLWSRVALMLLHNLSMKKHHPLGSKWVWLLCIVGETESILIGGEDEKSLVMLPRTCDLHSCVQQVPLLQPKRQKFGTGVGEIKISDCRVLLGWGSVGSCPQVKLWNGNWKVIYSIFPTIWLSVHFQRLFILSVGVGTEA